MSKYPKEVKDSIPEEVTAVLVELMDWNNPKNNKYKGNYDNYRMMDYKESELYDWTITFLSEVDCEGFVSKFYVLKPFLIQVVDKIVFKKRKRVKLRGKDDKIPVPAFKSYEEFKQWHEAAINFMYDVFLTEKAADELSQEDVPGFTLFPDDEVHKKMRREKWLRECRQRNGDQDRNRAHMILSSSDEDSSTPTRRSKRKKKRKTGENDDNNEERSLRRTFDDNDNGDDFLNQIQDNDINLTDEPIPSTQSQRQRKRKRDKSDRGIAEPRTKKQKTANKHKILPSDHAEHPLYDGLMKLHATSSPPYNQDIFTKSGYNNENDEISFIQKFIEEAGIEALKEYEDGINDKEEAVEEEEDEEYEEFEARIVCDHPCEFP